MDKKTLSEAITYILGRSILVPQADFWNLKNFETKIKYNKANDFIIDNSSPRKYGESQKHKRKK